MVSKKLFPKKKKNKVETVAKLKTTIHQLNLKTKEFNRKSNEAKLKAAKALKAGNKDLARQFLIRWKAYRSKTQRYYNMIGKIERHLEALEEAQVIQNVTGAFEASNKELEKISTTVNPEKAMELSENSETYISQIDEAADLLAGDLEIDTGLDVEDELAQLETELLMGDASSMPTVPELDESDLIDIEDSESEIKSKEKIKEEIEKLKKELDI
ncbi:MAG: Snf7 family protein [Promethearchaeota archaeon]